MPRGEARIYTSFRCNPLGRKWLDELADSHEVELSAVIRAALAVAKRHEPELKLTIKETKENA